jgi:hypothetical protein
MTLPPKQLSAMFLKSEPDGPLAHRVDLPEHERAISAEAHTQLLAGLDAAKAGKIVSVDPETWRSVVDWQAAADAEPAGFLAVNPSALRLRHGSSPREQILKRRKVERQARKNQRRKR